MTEFKRENLAVLGAKRDDKNMLGNILISRRNKDIVCLKIFFFKPCEVFPASTTPSVSTAPVLLASHKPFLIFPQKERKEKKSPQRPCCRPLNRSRTALTGFAIVLLTAIPPHNLLFPPPPPQSHINPHWLNQTSTAINHKPTVSTARGGLTGVYNW